MSEPRYRFCPRAGYKMMEAICHAVQDKNCENCELKKTETELTNEAFWKGEWDDNPN